MEKQTEDLEVSIMKKIWTVLLAGAMSISLVAC